METDDVSGGKDGFSLFHREKIENIFTYISLPIWVINYIIEQIYLNMTNIEKITIYLTPSSQFIFVLGCR